MTKNFDKLTLLSRVSGENKQPAGLKIKLTVLPQSALPNVRKCEKF